MNAQTNETTLTDTPLASRQFVYEALPMRVRFGAGTLSTLPEELDAIGLARVLVLCSPEQEDTGQRVAQALGTRCVGVLP